MNSQIIGNVVFIVIGVFLLGLVAPAMMSAPDTLMVGLGIVIGIFAISLLITACHDIVKMFTKEENGTKETQE
jgi:hypothetical protein